MSSDKGKERASSPDPYALSDSDGGSDDFFTVKRAPVIRPADETPIRSPTPPRRSHSGSDESDDEEGQHRKRKKPVRSRKKDGPSLPEWTRSGSIETKPSSGRGPKASSTQRTSTERADTITIIDSDDEPEASTSQRRGRVVLTPPPPISEAKRAEVHKLVQQHLGQALEADEEAEGTADNSPEKVEDGEKCTITIRMEAPPDRRAAAAPAAIKEYQKVRKLTAFRHTPMSKPLSILAERLQKRPEDIILVYDNDRVYPRSTPAQLGIIDRGEMTGYEKAYYDQIQKDRRALYLGSDDDPPDRTSVSSNSPVPDRSTNGAGPSEIGSVNADPLATAQAPTPVIRFRLRSSTGQEQHLKAPPDMKSISVLRFFCVKTGRPKEDAEKLKLLWDGEAVDKDTTIGELDIEDGDVLDVAGV
ncbi:hypothetical protein IAU60_004191 [Kwoniella sp. DSM 27419]